MTAVVGGNVSGRVRRGGAMKGVAEEIDGVALETESDVGVAGCGDTDVGVTEEFLGHDSTTCSRRRLAVKCRRSWNRMRRSLARRSRVVKCRVSVVPSTGAPLDQVKT